VTATLPGRHDPAQIVAGPDRPQITCSALFPLGSAKQLPAQRWSSASLWPLGRVPGNGPKRGPARPCSLGSALTITSGLEPIRYPRRKFEDGHVRRDYHPQGCGRAQKRDRVWIGVSSRWLITQLKQPVRRRCVPRAASTARLVSRLNAVAWWWPAAGWARAVPAQGFGTLGKGGLQCVAPGCGSWLSAWRRPASQLLPVA